jgi:hypothetical protein
MGAIQKRKMWKVAIVHFVLSLFLMFYTKHYLTWSGPPEREIWVMAWGTFWAKLVFLFQPQLVVLIKLKVYFHPTSHLIKFIFNFFILASIPIWSICFGWIYVKFTNWLNHFPVLGKKVFEIVNRKS